MSELRKDPVTRRWVIFDEKYKKKHTYQKKFKRKKRIKEREKCPFCPGNEQMTPPPTLVINGDSENTWSVRIIPDKYPIIESTQPVRAPYGIYDTIRGGGRHELLIESPYHSSRELLFRLSQIELVFEALKKRIKELKSLKYVKHCMILKNYKIDETEIAHPHSHIVALPVIPKSIKEELQGAFQYYSFKERCVFCDMILEEKRIEKRIVYENSKFLAFCPYASRFPFEIWVIPKKHSPDPCDMKKIEIKCLAKTLNQVFIMLARALNDPPFNLFIHISPFNVIDLPYYHWHIEIVPKILKLAGFEWGTGFYINSTLPRNAAKFLRQTL